MKWKFYHRLSRFYKRGFNLIEAAIVLAVVGLVIGGIWVAAQGAQQKIRYNQYSKGMLIINENVRNSFKGTDTVTPTYLSGYSNLLPSLLMGADGFSVAPTPSGGSYLRDPLGNVFYIRIDANRITYDFGPIKNEDCIPLTANVSANAKNHLMSIGLYTTTHTWYWTFPFIPTAAQCSGVTGLTFQYKF